MASCQVTGIPQELWLAFRRMCLEEGISANRKLGQLIETQVATGGEIDKGNSTDRGQK